MGTARVGLTFTVLFEGPFWVGVFERRDERGFSAARVVFGAEPGPGEIADCVSRQLPRLRFSEPTGEPPAQHARINPKRTQREAQRAAAAPRLSTQAQDALRAELERRKKVRLERSREARQEDEARRFELRQAKRKAKHRGH